MKKRNVSVEFARLVASFVVVLCHCNFFAVFAPESEGLHRFTTCLLADSVGMFWLISGFYFLQSRDYKKLWLGTIKRIAVPGLLMVFITQFLTDPIIYGIPFFESAAFSPEELRRFFISLVTFRETGVYWYVFAYILIVLIQPVLRLFGEWLDKSVMREIVFFAVTLLLLVINDINGNGIMHFSYSGIFVLIPAAIEVMWGHIIFRHRKFMLRPVMAVPELAAGIVLLMARTFSYSYMLENELGTHLVSWFTSFGFLSASIAVILCMQIIREDGEYSFSDAIRYPASYTYPIYLIHPFLLTFARVRGFFTVINDWLCVIFLHGVSSVLAVLIGFVVFYLASFFIAVVLRRLCGQK